MRLRRAWLQFLGLLTLASAAPTVDINDPVNLGTCTCDLTQGQCDVNCCCDPDCSGLSGLAGSFSCLPEGPVNANAQYCYSKSWLHSVNPRVDLWVIADDLRGLLCVSVDNSAVRGEVFQNEATLSSSQINAVIQERQRSTSTGAAADEQALRGYRAGDVLKIHSALSAAGEVLAVTGPSTLEAAGNVEVVSSLRLPTADPLGTCAAPGQAVRFLNDVPSAGCWRNVDLATTCTKLGARSRLESFMLRSQYMPEDMRCGSRCLLPEIVASCPAGSANGSASTQCTGNAPLEDPVFSGGADSCSCTGVLKDVHYNFTFGFDETQQVVRITNMAVSFTLQDVVSQGCQVVSLQQGGSVHFFQEQPDGSQPEARSGNPGYQNGLPLLVSQCLDFDSSGTCSSYGARAEATVPGITMAGTCRHVNTSCTVEQDDARVPINFGENSMSGCTVSLTREELAAFCRAGADAATGFTGLLAMLPFGRSGNRWTHIAAFGSVPTSAQDPADWVQVEELTRTEVPEFSDSAGAQKASNSTCTGVVTGVDLEVIYSYFGDVQNPQAKIVGARISHRLGVLSFTLEDPVERQSFPFGYSVSFLRAESDDFVLKVPPRPQLPVLLPDDLFYPFTIGSASRLGWSAVLALALLALAEFRTS